MNKAKEHLYSARWAISKALMTEDYGSPLDLALEEIELAKSVGIKPDDEPERPSSPLVETGDPKSEYRYDLPQIVRVPGIRFKRRGQFRTRSGKAKGIVVHYTVSGRKKKNAIGVLRYLAKKGLGCPVMDEDGIIYVPENYDFERDVVYHAGKSSWYGETNLSGFCIGMEICCWGLLPNGRKVDKVRISHGKANQKPGPYEAYTDAQEKALIDFCLWQLDVNPEMDIEWIVGHDEIAPTRKQDPGASLSLTMPEFRNHLKQLSEE